MQSAIEALYPEHTVMKDTLSRAKRLMTRTFCRQASICAMEPLCAFDLVELNSKNGGPFRAWLPNRYRPGQRGEADVRYS